MTLLETCLTVGIVSTTLTVAVPPLIQARQTYILSAAASDVSGKLHAARILAVSGSRDCRLRVESTTRYVIECQQAPSTWTTESTVDLPRGITITANARPEFHRRGNVSPTATVSVWNESGRVKRIVVNIAGRIRIQ